jgi:hypothetical protein
MKQRNPEARCGNCPYFKKTHVRRGDCLRWPAGLWSSMKAVTMPARVCGEHPDFFIEEQEELPKGFTA